jgi:hypothetical protein
MFTSGWPEDSGSSCRERGVSLTSVQASLDSDVEFAFHHLLTRSSYIGKCCMRDEGDAMLRNAASNIHRALSRGDCMLRRKIYPGYPSVDSLSQANNVFRMLTLVDVRLFLKHLSVTDTLIELCTQLRRDRPVSIDLHLILTFARLRHVR